MLLPLLFPPCDLSWIETRRRCANPVNFPSSPPGRLGRILDISLPIFAHLLTSLCFVYAHASPFFRYNITMHAILQRRAHHRRMSMRVPSTRRRSSSAGSRRPPATVTAPLSRIGSSTRRTPVAVRPVAARRREILGEPEYLAT